MLILRRKPEESITLEVAPSNTPTIIVVKNINDDIACMMGVDAPDEVSILRTELLTTDRIRNAVIRKRMGIHNANPKKD